MGASMSSVGLERYYEDAESSNRPTIGLERREARGN
jgi:hypothetical protein